jgi:hypothetical protein
MCRSQRTRLRSLTKSEDGMKRIIALALGALATGGGTIAAQAGVPSAKQAPAACSANGKDVTIAGDAATVFCGPAKATVRVGSQTMTFRNGTCVWTSNSFKLRLGTIFLSRSKPLQKQAGFSIYATGIPVARALVQVYWRGQYTATSPLHETARPSASRAGGTFTGKAGKAGTGPSVSGTVTCS